MQRGAEGKELCREEKKREGSHAERSRGNEVMPGRAERGESCKEGDKREGSRAGRGNNGRGVMQRGAEGR